MTSGDEAGMRFKEKSVVVTGGASGIGRAVTEQFAQEGAAVVIADIDRESTQDTAEAISARGGRALPVNVGVSHPRSVQEMIDTTVNANGRLDVIVNGAAVPSVSKIIDISFETWDKVPPTMTSPAVGRIMAEMVLNGHSDDPVVAPLHPRRFSTGELVPEPLTV